MDTRQGSAAADLALVRWIDELHCQHLYYRCQRIWDWLEDRDEWAKPALEEPFYRPIK